MSDEIFGQWQCLFESRLKCFAPFLADQRIGIVTVRQKQKAQLPTLAHLTQGILQRFPGCGPASAIAIETENHFVTNAEHAR